MKMLTAAKVVRQVKNANGSSPILGWNVSKEFVKKRNANLTQSVRWIVFASRATALT